VNSWFPGPRIPRGRGRVPPPREDGICAAPGWSDPEANADPQQRERELKNTSSRGAKAITLAGAASLMVGGIAISASTVGATVKTAHTSAYLACVVTDTGGINDKSFNASAYAGLVAAQNKLGKSKLNIKYLSSQQESDYAPNIKTFVNEKCGIIVTVGFLMGNATWTAAHSYPNQHFAIVDQTNGDPNCYSGKCATAANIDGLTYSTDQDGFLAGYEAAAVSKSHIIATYGGMQFGSVTIYEDGFVAGARYYNAHLPKGGHKVKVLGWNPNTQKGDFVGSFTDQAGAATLTTGYLTSGADLVFPVAGSDGLGTNSAVKTWNSSHVNKALVDWVDTDGCVSDAGDCNLFLGSVTKGVTASVRDAVLAAQAGKFKGGNYVGNLKNAGVALVENTKYNKISASLAGTIKSLMAQIESGKISVDPTKYAASTN